MQLGQILIFFKLDKINSIYHLTLNLSSFLDYFDFFLVNFYLKAICINWLDLKQLIIFIDSPTFDGITVTCAS